VFPSEIVSRRALELNPLVVGWDDVRRPTRIELEDGRTFRLDPDRVSIPADDAALAGLLRATQDAFGTCQFDVPCPGGGLSCGPRTLVMGVINTTPDSFSDGGQWLDRDKAVEHALNLVAEGAHILDVGGESTRPGAEPVPADEERRRTVPVIAELVRRCDVPLSIDTGKASVARAALEAGAAIVNDVTALGDPEMASVVARHGAGLVLMHMKGEPRTMQKHPVYGDVLREIALYLRRAMARAIGAGVPPEAIIVDPGIGFGKALAHNAEILRRLPVLAGLGRPILVGCSRKSLIQHALGLPLERRLHATLALDVLSILGRAAIIRVHDVQEAVEVAGMVDATRSGTPLTCGEG